MNIISVVKMGRLSDAVQRDHGIVRHAMLEDDYRFGAHSKALCGTKPGRRSVGWANDKDITEITCDRCLKKLKK